MCYLGIYTSPSKEENLENHQQDSIAIVQRQKAEQESVKTQEASTPTETAVSDSVKNKMVISQYGAFAKAAEDTAKFYTLENSKIKLTISNKGGRPYAVQLKEYHRYDSSDLILFKGDSTVFGLNFPTNQNRTIFTNDLFFKASENQKDIVVSPGQKPETLSMRLYAGTNSYIEYLYTLAPDDYMVGFKINMVGMDSVVASNYSSLDIIWKSVIPRQEMGRKNENNYTTIVYKHLGEDVDEISAGIGANQTEEENIPNSIKWIAFKQHFFSSVLIAENRFNKPVLRSTNLEDTSKLLKAFEAVLPISYENKPNFTSDFRFYFGPNHYNTLKAYNLDMEHIVPLGWSWIRWISKYFIIPVFNWLDNYIANYGIIILVLTILIKLILFPLTYKSYLSQARMRVLKPQIDEINAKIPKDKPLERQQATMALYKKAGVNPMGGCLPLLLQMPILFAMFYFFPTSIELRQEGFLWATDLSTYDSIFSWSTDIPLISRFYGNHISLFTILMTVSTLVSMKMSNQAQMSDAQLPGMKTMMYIMPVMFMFVLNGFSSGLTYYYFLANMITIGQNELFKRMIDEKKILAKIHANKAKPVKKSKFQERLEKMAKERGMKVPAKKK
ncbi:MAG: membrane protein insertase YidC [Bacteroidales bacterium]|nr:membrane protein insertase YidC [Bacteroidales bacterium]